MGGSSRWRRVWWSISIWNWNFRIASIVLLFVFRCFFFHCQCHIHVYIKKFNYATNYKSIFHLVIAIVSLRIRIILLCSLFLSTFYSASWFSLFFPGDDALHVLYWHGKAIGFDRSSRSHWYIFNVFFDEFDSLAAQQSFVWKIFSSDRRSMSNFTLWPHIHWMRLKLCASKHRCNLQYFFFRR